MRVTRIRFRIEANFEESCNATLLTGNRFVQMLSNVDSLDTCELGESARIFLCPRVLAFSLPFPS